MKGRWVSMGDSTAVSRGSQRETHARALREGNPHGKQEMCGNPREKCRKCLPGRFTTKTSLCMEICTQSKTNLGHLLCNTGIARALLCRNRRTLCEEARADHKHLQDHMMQVIARGSMPFWWRAPMELPDMRGRFTMRGSYSRFQIRTPNKR